jgi:hypothetical protein
MKRVLAIFFAVSAFPLLSVLGQNGGSILSRYGIGDLSGFQTARQRGLGGLATPLQSDQDISQLNPAAWTLVEGLRVQGDLSYEFESYSKNSNLSIGSTGLSGFQFSVPVQEELRSRIVFGFLPYSRVGYKLRSDGAIDGDRYGVEYLGNGGLSIIRLGTAIRPVPFLSLGASAHYFFGVIDQEWDIDFENGTRFDTKESRLTNFHGFGYTLGAQVTVDNRFMAGIAVEPSVTLTGSRNVFFQYITNDSTVEGASGELNIPLRFTAGIAAYITPRLLAAAEFQVQDWAGATVFDGVQQQLDRAMRFSAGLEWQPGRGEFQPDFWKRTAYRIGFSLRELPVRLTGETERETFITAGMGIPILQQNRADVALEYGWRGSDASMLGPRSVIRLSLSMSVGESWFVRRGQD